MGFNAPSSASEMREQQLAKTRAELAPGILQTPEQQLVNVGSATMTGTNVDVLLEKAAKEKRVHVPDLPVHEWAGKLLDTLSQHAFPTELRNEIKGYIEPLTKRGDDNMYLDMQKKNVNADLLLHNLRLVEGMSETTTGVKQSFLWEVATILDTTMTRKVQVEDGYLQKPLANIPENLNAAGKLARGRELLNTSPHSEFMKGTGRQLGFILGALVTMFGVSVTIMDLIQKKKFEPHKGIFMGGLIAFLFAQGSDLFEGYTQKVVDQAKWISKPEVKTVLRDNNIQGDAGEKLLLQLASSSKSEARDAYLNADKGNEKARTDFLKAMGDSEKLAAMSPAQLRVLVSAANNIEEKDAQELAGTFVKEAGWKSPLLPSKPVEEEPAPVAPVNL